MKWMCAGRQGWRAVAASMRPTGPSSGIGYGTGRIVRNTNRPSSPVTNRPRRFSGDCAGSWTA